MVLPRPSSISCPPRGKNALELNRFRPRRIRRRRGGPPTRCLAAPNLSAPSACVCRIGKRASNRCWKDKQQRSKDTKETNEADNNVSVFVTLLLDLHPLP